MEVDEREQKNLILNLKLHKEPKVGCGDNDMVSFDVTIVPRDFTIHLILEKVYHG